MNFINLFSLLSCYNTNYYDMKLCFNLSKFNLFHYISVSMLKQKPWFKIKYINLSYITLAENNNNVVNTYF